MYRIELHALCRIDFQDIRLIGRAESLIAFRCEVDGLCIDQRCHQTCDEIFLLYAVRFEHDAVAGFAACLRRHGFCQHDLIVMLREASVHREDVFCQAVIVKDICLCVDMFFRYIDKEVRCGTGAEHFPDFRQGCKLLCKCRTVCAGHQRDLDCAQFMACNTPHR